MFEPHPQVDKDSPPLPSSISLSVSLQPSTQTEQSSVILANSAAFRGVLSTAAYVRREQHLASQPLTTDGGLTGWVLVDTSTQPRRVLCSCETIRKRALVGVGGKVEEVVCHAVASVFCVEEHRRRGYAGRMMKDLAARLRTWQTGVEKRRVAFSVLYSDIGKSYYAAYGWQTYPSSHITLPKAASSDNHGSEKVQLLYASSIEDLCASDEARLKQDFSRRAQTEDKVSVAVIPDAKAMQWHHAREDFIAQELHHDPPKIKGACVGKEVGKRAWCIWARKWGRADDHGQDNILFILRLVVEDRDEDKRQQIDKVAALLGEAQRQAELWEMAQVQIWNPTAITLQAAQRMIPTVKVEDRSDDSITSLMWYGDDLKHVDDLDATKIEWIDNEKYGWC